MTVPLPAQGVQVGDPGHVSDHNAIANFLQQAAQAGELGTSAAYMPYNLRTYGALGNGLHDDTAAILAAFQAAENNGGRKKIYAPVGTYVITGTLALTGFSSVLVGDGCQDSSGVTGGTTFKCVSQTGPVLDFTGYNWPDYGGRMSFSGFNVAGDGTSDAAGVKIGIKLTGALNTSFSDITISACGAAALQINGASYCDFSRVLITNPLGAKSNDVPYIYAASILGCRFTNILLHSLTGSADVGISGAIRVLDRTGGLSSMGNTFSGLMFDTLHVPTSGSVFWHKGNSSVLENFAFNGCVKESAATGTAFVRFSPPATDTGGNTFTGVIPGKGSGATDIDTGIDLAQSNNRITGTKGFRGTNVTLETGVGGTTVELQGAVGAATDPGIVDNSAVATNVLSDSYLALNRAQTYTTAPKAVADGGAGIQVSDAANPQVGALYLGNQGPMVQTGSTDPKSLYFTGNKQYFRDTTKAITPLTVSTVSSDPSALLVATGSALTALRAGGNLDFVTDSTNDIGGASDNRPRDLNLARNASVGGTLTVAGAAAVASMTVGGVAVPHLVCGGVANLSTDNVGRFSWANPLGTQPRTILLGAQSTGSAAGSYQPFLVTASPTTILLVFIIASTGALAASKTGLNFQFILVA